MQNTLAVILLVVLVGFACNSKADFLRVSGRDLYYGSNRVFLSGVNFAWKAYGYDFGNNQYEANARQSFEQWIRDVKNAGGNTVRIWLHVEGTNTPEFNWDGYVIGMDRDGTLVQDLTRLLDFAAEQDVLVIPVLWNGALMGNDNFKNLVWDDNKLYSYIWYCLRPMVQALKDKPALAAWEIMNEPEGSVRIETNSNPCYDTAWMGQHGAGWTGANIPMERFLAFISQQAAAIHEVDPKAVVTLGSWSEHPQSDSYSDTFNYYKDSCLVPAGGGNPLGKIDFYQMHSYAWEGRWNPHGPFMVTAQSYNLDKPLVIGEYSHDCATGESIEDLFAHAYNAGYQGAWSWQYNEGGHCSDNQATQNRGMQHIRNFNHNGIIPIEVQ